MGGLSSLEVSADFPWHIGVDFDFVICKFEKLGSRC